MIIYIINTRIGLFDENLPLYTLSCCIPVIIRPRMIRPTNTKREIGNASLYHIDQWTLHKPFPRQTSIHRNKMP